jgi:hypothetical protein
VVAVCCVDLQVDVVVARESEADGLGCRGTAMLDGKQQPASMSSQVQ